MDRDLARHLATVALKSSSRLTELVPLLKEHCDKDEYEAYGKAIAWVSATIYSEILKKIFALYPDFEKEFDTKIEKYGRMI